MLELAKPRPTPNGSPIRRGARAFVARTANDPIPLQPAQHRDSHVEVLDWGIVFAQTQEPLAYFECFADAIMAALIQPKPP